MNATGAVFQPELIQLMKTVLDDAAATLPEAKRTSTMKAEIASQILACAAKGERDPVALKNFALLAVVECTHYSHDISPERRAVLVGAPTVHRSSSNFSAGRVTELAASLPARY